MATLGYRKRHRERKKERKKEGEELADRRHGFKFLAEIELLTFVWSRSAAATWNCCRSFQAWLETTHTYRFTPTSAWHGPPGWGTVRSCVCTRLPCLLWMVVIELKSSTHNFISLHLWGVDLNWMADYSQPALFSAPHEASTASVGMYGCLPTCAVHLCVFVRVWWKHLTPAIIAFRLVTGRISIHSGWDLFFQGGCREMFSQNWWHLFWPRRI